MSNILQINDKYSVKLNDDGEPVTILRHGEPFNQTGLLHNNIVLGLVHRVQELLEEVKTVKLDAKSAHDKRAEAEALAPMELLTSSAFVKLRKGLWINPNCVTSVESSGEHSCHIVLNGGVFESLDIPAEKLLEKLNAV